VGAEAGCVSTGACLRQRPVSGALERRPGFFEDQRCSGSAGVAPG
jgi:hypothetical protein